MAADLSGGGVDAEGSGGQGGGLGDGAVAGDELVALRAAPGASGVDGQQALALGLGQGEVGEGFAEVFPAGDEKGALGVLPLMA
ncbi:hypothetical protein PXH67_19050 [Streptomyces sp. P8-A8]|uniref:hypothetical protein n=1 Tax=unclassified Streptomyces TaxID=2593676 RepID=UPI000F5B8D8B|nr:hypothetical protein [Streptomyces sp. ADI95-17]